MFPATEANTLLDLARAVAKAKFDSDGSARNSDKVCVVALNLDTPPATYALFSGAPGYSELTEIVSAGGDKKQAQQTITSRISEFLSTEAGGSFSRDQINNAGYDRHGRGAMNCAEPKMYYLLKHQLGQTLRNWILIPFNFQPEGGAIVYNAPCKNCRRWVYRHFHGLSALIAQSQNGPEAFNTNSDA